MKMQSRFAAVIFMARTMPAEEWVVRTGLTLWRVLTAQRESTARTYGNEHQVEYLQLCVYFKNVARCGGGGDGEVISNFS